MGAAIVLGTMACSFSLPDISNLPRLAVMGVALAMAMLCYRRLEMPRSLGTLAFGLFILFTSASTIWAVNKGEALYDTARWIMAAGLFTTIYTLHRRHPARTVVMLSRAALIVIVVSFGVALKQLDALGGDFSWDNRYSIVSLYTHKGTFALLMLAATLPIVLRLRLRLGRVRIVYWTILAIAAAVVLFLSARTVLLALVVLVAILFLTLIPIKPLSTKHHPLATLLLAILLGTALIGGTRFFCRLPLGDTPGSSGGVLSSATILERHALWNTTLRLVDRHPLVGVGVGNWKVCYPEVSTADIFSVDVLDFTFVRPHNDYLRVLSETGYIGLTLLLIALASPIARAIGRTPRRRRTGGMTAITLAYTTAMIVAALIDFPFDRTETLLWCSLTVALLSASTPSQRFPMGAARWPFAVLMAAVVVLAIVRIQSEREYPDVISANHSRQWNTMENAAHKAQSPLCNLTPSGTPYAYYEAMAQEQLGKPSLETFATALHDSPWHKQSLNDMGRLVYTVNHDTDSAETLFKKAIHVSPSFAHAYFNLAQLYLMEERPEEAREVLLAFDPDKKQQRIDRLVWHYLNGENALYYQHHLIPPEKQMRDRMLVLCGQQ